MKRFLFFFAAMTLAIGGTAFGAEPKVKFWRDKEVILQDDAICKNGKWMVTLEDFERLTGCQIKDNGDFIILQRAVVLRKENTVALEPTRTAYLLPDWTLFGMAHGAYSKLELAEDIFRQDDKLYVPCRDIAAALGYDVIWGMWGEQEMVELKEQEMPEITLTVEYDIETDKLNGIIENKEPQAFLFGLEYTLERLTEDGWVRVIEAEPRDLDDVGYIMNATRSQTGENGISHVQRYVYAKLPKGEYRMGIPFRYRYYVKNVYGNLEDERTKSEDTDKLDWDYYYSTYWGKPDFYFEGEGLSTYNAQKDTHYVLYGGFTVK